MTITYNPKWCHLFTIWHTVHSSHQFSGEVTNQITNSKSLFFFSVLGHQNVLYNSVVIIISNLQSQTNYTAHLGDFKHKNWSFEISDFVGDFTKKLVARMDGEHLKTLKLQTRAFQLKSTTGRIPGSQVLRRVA